MEENQTQGPPKPPRLHIKRKSSEKSKRKHLQFQSPLLYQETSKEMKLHNSSDKAKPTILVQRQELRADTPIVNLKSLRIPPTEIAETSTNFSGSIEMHGDILTVESIGLPNDHLRTSSSFKMINASNAAKQWENRLSQGCTSLMHACQQGDVAAVFEEMRTKPERIRLRDSHYKNALHYCAAQSVARTGDLVAAASIAVAAPELLESADEDGFTPLHLAVIQGNLAMVNLLLANKADVNAVDKEGHSVVHWATVCGEVGALRAVLAAGANVATPDINGGSPLHYAAQMCGASYEGKLSQANSHKLALEILGILLAHPQCSVDVEDKDGRQPLLWAASAGSAKAILALVKAGARVESADKDGLTALHCAASRGHTECIDTLISLSGAPTDLIDSNGCTALHYAVTLGHADATSRLLDFEADPNRQDRKGRTPAHCGCAKGQFETVKLLKERNANLWLRNAKGDLPLHEAASSGRRELVEWLLEQRPKQVNTTSNDGRSMLHIAAANDYTDMCKMLIDYGADLNSIYRNSKGVVMTPLDCCMQKGHRSTAKYLQSHGGLPAGKLKLASRRANPFSQNSMEVVKPLQYVEKEEIQDLSNSKKYVVYLKRSESDAAEDGNCSCTEQTYRREQRYAHTCSRHQKTKSQQLRRRTSSCGDPQESDHDCGGMCRSKSNIEIRRRKSRERYVSSSECEDEEGDEDSCENCCYHKRKKQRVVQRRKSISHKRSREAVDSDGRDEDADADARQKQLSREKDVTETAEQSSKLVPEETKAGHETAGDANASATEIASGIFSRAETPVKPSAATTPIAATKEDTFIKSPTATADVDKSSVHAAELSDEDEPQNPPGSVTTEVQIHHAADEGNLAENTEQEIKKPEMQSQLASGLTQEVSKQVDEVIQAASAVIDSNAIAAKEGVEAIAETKSEVAMQDEKPSSSEATKPGSEATNLLQDDEKSKEKEEFLKKDQLDAEHLASSPANDKSTAITTAKASDVADAKHDTEAKTSIKPTENTSKTHATSDVLNEVTESAAKDAAGTAKKSEANEDAAQKLGGHSKEATAQQQEKTFADGIAETGGDAKQPGNASADETSKTDGAAHRSDYTSIDGAAKTDGASPQGDVAQAREQESRRSFTLLPSDSADDEAPATPIAPEALRRKSSFHVLKSDESAAEIDDSNSPREDVELSDSTVFKVLSATTTNQLLDANADRSDDNVLKDDELDEEEEDDAAAVGIAAAAAGQQERNFRTPEDPLSPYDYGSGRKRRLKKRIKSGVKSRSNWQRAEADTDKQQANRDQDSGFEPSPRTFKTKIPTPRNIYTAHIPRRPLYTTLDGRSCSSRLENRKLGDKGACDMTAVTRSIQRNIRRYYMERKIFQHLLELKSLQIRSNKLNEAVLVKRAVDDYHKSCAALGGETGTRLRRYNFSEYTFKNFELFLYETLKALQKPGTYNFQNINEVYEEAERRLSPDYNAYEKALQCTTRTHRCLHAAHAYTGIPCAAYIPMMNHHTMPKFGFGQYKKTGVGSFYLPKILTTGTGCGGKVALELSHGKNKQLISLPSDKLDSNKRYFVTFTVKESEKTSGGSCESKGAADGGGGGVANGGACGTGPTSK